MPGSGVPAATETRRARTDYAGIGLLSALIAWVAFATGAEWLIAVVGFSYATLGFTGGIANRYRARTEQGSVP